MSLEYIDKLTENINKVYITTSIDEYKKFDNTNMYWCKNGDGRLYYKQLTPKTVIGCSSLEIHDDLGTYKEADTFIHKCIPFCLIDSTDGEKRLNRLDIKWTFETVNEVEELKSFLSTVNTPMLYKITSNAEASFKERYNVTLKGPIARGGKDDGMTQDELINYFNNEYEKYMNRYVTSYHIIGLDNDTNAPMVFAVLWYDYESLSYIESNLDKFIKIGTYKILNLDE